MTALLAVLLFGAALLVSIWTLVASIRSQLPRMRELLDGASVDALPAAAPVRIRLRSPAPAYRPARFPLRAAA